MGESLSNRLGKRFGESFFLRVGGVTGLGRNWLTVSVRCWVRGQVESWMLDSPRIIKISLHYISSKSKYATSMVQSIAASES